MWVDMAETMGHESRDLFSFVLSILHDFGKFGNFGILKKFLVFFVDIVSIVYLAVDR